ncbi:MAG TPA: MotA/TolQ/ExbB proton channel family protein [Myxococcota bacterium]|nr:MotA/TolQ/ExbB proton channel family protein [Myxococcota bacterium]
MIDPVQMFRDGGAMMWVNLAVFAFALTIVAERMFVLMFRLRIDHDSFLTQVEKLVMAGNFERAIKMCQTFEDAAVPRVVRAGLSNAKLGAGAVSASIEEAMSEVVPRVTRRAGILWGIANLATLIGLVGTVFGLIQAFAAISLAAPDQKSTMLTEGIAHAMSNTAFGLAIAVICVFFHMLIAATTKGVLEGIEHSSIRIENILARRRFETESRDAGAAQANG